MVWFQCEDCGENLKKPKLPNHFRFCSSRKLSCIDCGDTFTKESVQSHTQCMTEAEKYGPKDLGKSTQNSSNKPEKPKKNADVCIDIGLSSHPPWFCSLCNTSTTSKQTLLGHADGKKHRAKAKAFLSAQKQSIQSEETKDIEKLEPVKETCSIVDKPKENASSEQILENKFEKKRKHSYDVENNSVNDGEVIQAEGEEDEGRTERHKNEEKMVNSEPGAAPKKKIKWKKLVMSTLTSKPDRAMKIKKLKKLLIDELKLSGINGDDTQMCNDMMNKINSSSKFVINGKIISLSSKSDKP